MFCQSSEQIRSIYCI
uniref:Uncharacterized protein n=1 Tax=Arundo donax TaxID=35708 RepID=A0A0A9GKY9_ARUDO